MKFHVRQIAHETAVEFIERWHYSHRCPTGQNIFFGMFVDGLSGANANLFGESLYAVANYGIGVNPYQAQFLAQLTGRDVQSDTLLELKRLCRIEPKPEGLELTAFIAKCHKRLAVMGYRYVVSFSDPAHGHTGGIYRAANFLHLGKTNAETHAMNAEGEVRHRRLYFRHSRRNDVSVEESRSALGLVLTKTVPKDRWFIAIGK